MKPGLRSKGPWPTNWPCSQREPQGEQHDLFRRFHRPRAREQQGRLHQARRQFAPLVQDLGVQRMVEAWESDVPEGKVTDFRKAVDAKPDEKIVFSFFEYPTEAARDAANAKFMSDPRMSDMSDMPFDGKRMIMGGFE